MVREKYSKRSWLINFHIQEAKLNKYKCVKYQTLKKRPSKRSLKGIKKKREKQLDLQEISLSTRAGR